MSDAAVFDVAASRQALAELRRARRVSHREAVHWVDAIYRVYISALGAVIVIVLGSSVFGERKIPLAEATAFATNATPWLGLAFAAAVGIGLRSGGRGGPLTLQAATVQHELLAPIDPAVVLREPAVKQLRFMAFTGACAGAVIAMTGVRQLPVNATALVLGAAAACAVALVLSVSVAMILSGRRISSPVANALAAALVAWSAIDLLASVETSPMTLLGRLAFASFSFPSLALVPVALTALAVPVAVLGLGGTSIDDARRRAGLVAQLRFAVTLQDIRTVVLLRRQLAQETPRARPWIRLRPSRLGPGSRLARISATWRRDWRCYLRFPLVRIVRLVVLAGVAGAALGATWNGVRPAFLISAVALYLAAYDAVEPIGQEVDHPSRWDGLPEDHGIVLLNHVVAAVVVMLVVCVLAAAVATIIVPASVVLELAPVLLLGVALSSVAAAAASTAMGAPDLGKMLATGGADMMGVVLLLRMVLPPALIVGSLAPAFRAGVDPGALDMEALQQVAGYPVIAAAFALVYVRFRTPSRV